MELHGRRANEQTPPDTSRDTSRDASHDTSRDSGELEYEDVVSVYTALQGRQYREPPAKASEYAQFDSEPKYLAPTPYDPKHSGHVFNLYESPPEVKPVPSVLPPGDRPADRYIIDNNGNGNTSDPPDYSGDDIHGDARCCPRVTRRHMCVVMVIMVLVIAGLLAVILKLSLPAKSSTTEAQKHSDGFLPETPTLAADVASGWFLDDMSGVDVSSADDDVLLFHYDEYKKIEQAAFLENGALAFISHQHSDDLLVLDLQGRDSTLPFQASFVSPRGVCSSNGGTTVAVVDRIDRKTFKIYIYEKSKGWAREEITYPGYVYWCALSRDGSGVIVVKPYNSTQQSLLKLTRGGSSSVAWEHVIPTKTNLWMPRFDTDHNGRIVLSNPNYDRVTLLDQNGDQIREFPKQFIKKPAGVAFTPRGDVMIGDYANDTYTVQLFSPDGVHIGSSVDLDALPHHIAFHKYGYLAVSNWDNGVYMYSI